MEYLGKRRVEAEIGSSALSLVCINESSAHTRFAGPGPLPSTQTSRVVVNMLQSYTCLGTEMIMLLEKELACS